jgi:hypothetical protein
MAWWSYSPDSETNNDVGLLSKLPSAPAGRRRGFSFWHMQRMVHTENQQLLTAAKYMEFKEEGVLRYECCPKGWRTGWGDPDGTASRPRFVLMIGRVGESDR